MSAEGSEQGDVIVSDLEDGVYLRWTDQAKHVWKLTCELRSERRKELDMQRARA